MTKRKFTPRQRTNTLWAKRATKITRNSSDALQRSLSVQNALSSSDAAFLVRDETPFLCCLCSLAFPTKVRRCHVEHAIAVQPRFFRVFLSFLCFLLRFFPTRSTRTRCTREAPRTQQRIRRLKEKNYWKIKKCVRSDDSRREGRNGDKRRKRFIGYRTGEVSKDDAIFTSKIIIEVRTINNWIRILSEFRTGIRVQRLSIFYFYRQLLLKILCKMLIFGERRFILNWLLKERRKACFENFEIFFWKNLFFVT